ncbi:PAAR-like domain-containing protein [Fulvimarina sp. MAC8]|uniref:PAAR-like domain-containing protein n=1 Tax=Fulvimarina sp. MAC8 TaxID=3162874 RepID=UPI0032F07D60
MAVSPTCVLSSNSDADYVGEPDYPAPWTTRQPKEGLRDIDAARIVCLAPDVCLTPIGDTAVPIPYQIVDYAGHDAGYADSVRFTGKKVMTLASRTTHVHGDAPGTKKGVKSGTVEDITEPIGHAPEVRAEGHPVIRHLDRFHMNSRNTVGEAVYVKDTATYRPPGDDDPVPGSLRRFESEAAVMSDVSPDPLIMGAQYAQAMPVEQAVPAPEPPSTPSPPQAPSRKPSLPPAANDNRPQVRRGIFGRFRPNPFWMWLEHTIGRYPEDRRRIRAGELDRVAENPSLSEAAADILHETAERMRNAPTPADAERIEQAGWERLRELERQGALNPTADEQAQQDENRRANEKVEKSNRLALALAHNVRVDTRNKRKYPCIVGPYKYVEMICPGEAHHLIPDRVYRLGRAPTYNERDSTENRIRNWTPRRTSPLIVIYDFLGLFGVGRMRCVVSRGSGISMNGMAA